MKVYRMTMEGTCYKPFYGVCRSSLESLYYEMGYILAKNPIRGGSNNISCRIDKNDPGHYFFIFPEDALHFAIYTLHPAATLKIMEYDFPEDVVYSLIGWGIYQQADGYNYDKRAETYINDSKIDGEHILSTNIDESDKRETLIDEFRRSQLVLKDYFDNHNYDIKYARTQFDKEIEKFLELSDSELFDNFINTKKFFEYAEGIYQKFTSPRREYDLIKTPSITNRSSLFLFSLWDKNHVFGRSEIPEIASYNEELLSKNGIILDYSKSGIDCRIDYTKMIEKKDYESAKRLLQSYRS